MNEYYYDSKGLLKSVNEYYYEDSKGRLRHRTCGRFVSGYYGECVYCPKEPEPKEDKRRMP